GLAGRAGAPLVLPAADGAAHVFQAYVLRARDRDGLVAHLPARGVGAPGDYRGPPHLQPPLRAPALVPPPPVEGERAAKEVLALPIYPELTREQIDAVVDAVARFYGVGA